MWWLQTPSVSPARAALRYRILSLPPTGSTVAVERLGYVVSIQPKEAAPSPIEAAG
jgi:hypothetical protein